MTLPLKNYQESLELLANENKSENEEQNVWVRSIVVVQAANAFPHHRPHEVGTMAQGVVRQERNEAVPVTIGGCQFQAELRKCSGGLLGKAMLPRIQSREFHVPRGRRVALDAPNSGRVRDCLRSVRIQDRTTR